MDAPKYEITQSIAILSTEKSGWTKELNLIAWTAEELSALKAAISDLA